MKTILVIGGGITGLSTMYELQKWKQKHNANIKLILVEATEQLGGKIQTEKKEDFIIEAGADSIVTRKLKSGLLDELGLHDEVIYNDTGRSYIYIDGDVKPIPADSVFGIPTSIESLTESTLVSTEGKDAALKDLYTKNEHFQESDSIGEFLEYFLGKELVEKQIGPVMSGVYSGSLYDLTISATLPYLIEYKNKYGSIIKGFEANQEKFQSSGEKKFISFKNGLDSLIYAIEKRLEDVEIKKNWPVERIHKEDNYYRVISATGNELISDYVVLSLPHEQTNHILNDKALNEDFAKFKTSSLISVYLAYDIPDHILPKEGTGFITANNEELYCNACTWTSRKWSHTSKKHNLLVRFFYKSSHPFFSTLQSMNEKQLLEIALRDMELALNITTHPVEHLITKWTNQMPAYQITHPKTIRNIENKLNLNYPGIYIAGCSYYGVGIADCINNGIDTAQRIISRL
ncbi:protoporphyrinogen oxidase [Metabacillus malikii]|uniref:Coproporphyrinogen III oxidase n=1 Tax=Metabacillus malikii TaxID=1504265 RepID=A0ABT9ZDK3_9BACI|nr:protoporphyrinogen oxidase [Metabacillus malikii]MDQ0230351.1 oxygen-dependent protoporphyrinogen oxidase [Metabacillus malikii]